MELVVAAGLTLAMNGVALAAHWVRLRWRAREQEIEAECLAVLAGSLQPGGRLDHRGDGRSWTLSVGKELADRG